MRAACGLFTQDNIELVRDYLLVGYALEAAGWLDSQAFEAWRQDYAALGYYDQLSSSATTAEETAFNLTSAVLPTPVGRAYAEAYNLEHIKEFVEGLCKDAIDSHKHIVTNSEWLSDASCARGRWYVPRARSAHRPMVGAQFAYETTGMSPAVSA